MKNQKHRLLVLSGTLVMILAACSPATLTEQILERQEGIGNVEIDEEDGTVKIEIEGEDGDASVVFGGGEVPDGFPIPIADGGTVMAVAERGAESTVSLSYEDADYESLKSFYEDWIDGLGAEVLNKFESSSPKATSWSLQDGDENYNITLSQAGEETFVMLIVTDA